MTAAYWAAAGAGTLAAVWLLPRVVLDPTLRRMLRPPRRLARPLPDDLDARAHDATIPGEYLPMKAWLLVPDGKPSGLVVFIPGWSSDAGRISSMARPSLDSGLACLLVDLPGHGRTGPVEIYNAPRMMDDLLSVRDWIASRADLAALPAGIVGYSFGGLGALVAACRDRRWSAAVSVAAPSGPMKATELYLSGKGLPTGLMHRLLRASVVRVVGIDPDVFDGPRNLASIEVPVLVVHGTEDHVVPISEADRIESAVPERLRHRLYLDGAGHDEPMADRAVAEKIAAFLVGALTAARPAAKAGGGNR